MTDQSFKLTALPPSVGRWTIPVVVGLAVAVAIILLRPDFSLILKQPLVIQIHLLAAVAGFGLGVVLLNSRKGRTFHRIAGWVWVVFMMTVALSSLFIVGLNGNYWSFIHIFSGMTLVMAPLGVLAARKHNVKAHRQRMTSLFYGAVVVAGAFTFLPGRIMYQVFFGH